MQDCHLRKEPALRDCLPALIVILSRRRRISVRGAYERNAIKYQSAGRSRWGQRRRQSASSFLLPAGSGWMPLFISRNSMAMISVLRPLSPLWCLRHHLSPRESVSLDSRASKGSLRIQFPCHPAKAGALWILSNVPHSSEGNRRANLPLRGRRRRRRQKGCISIARRAVCLFSTGEARLYGFAAGRRHKKWRHKAPTSPATRSAD